MHLRYLRRNRIRESTIHPSLRPSVHPSSQDQKKTEKKKRFEPLPLFPLHELDCACASPPSASPLSSMPPPCRDNVFLSTPFGLSGVTSLGFLLLVSFRGCRFPLLVIASLSDATSDVIVSVEARFATARRLSIDPSRVVVVATAPREAVRDPLTGGEDIGPVALLVLSVRFRSRGCCVVVSHTMHL